MVYPVARFIVPKILGIWIRSVEGLGNVPMDRPFIIAVNHASYIDAVLMHCIIIPKINKNIHAFVNSNYWKNPFTRIIVDWGCSIPVFLGKDKDAKQKNNAAFDRAIEFINKGGIIQIFPEGRRSRDGKLQRAYNGIARLALESGIDVVPCAIIGSHNVLPKGKFFPRFARCRVKIGKPMSFKKYLAKKNAKNTDIILQNITRSIMKEIAKLIGQEYNF